LVRSVTAVAAYLVAMVAIIVGLRVGRAPLLAELSRRFGLAHDVAAVALAGCGLVLALPFVLGFARRVRRIGTELAGRVLPTTSAGVDLADAPRRALVVGLELAASMLALVPLLAVTAPFLPLYAGGGVLAVVMLGLGNLFWRRARNLHGHARAGAELVLELLDRQRRQDDDEPARSALPQLLPGLGPLAPIDIAPDSEAAGKTLAELNLRVRTGATVLAVKRADGSGVGMPAGHDRVDVGDVLTVSGTTEAVELARRLLAPPSPRRRPPDDVA
jgi:CPA2 family monovalent cation:H+ antiporter-2